MERYVRNCPSYRKTRSPLKTSAGIIIHSHPSCEDCLWRQLVSQDSLSCQEEIINLFLKINWSKWCQKGGSHEPLKVLTCVCPLQLFQLAYTSAPLHTIKPSVGSLPDAVTSTLGRPLSLAVLNKFSLNLLKVWHWPPASPPFLAL